MIRTTSIALLAVVSLNAQAAFDFGLDRIQLTGDATFDDDFIDGIVEPDFDFFTNPTGKFITSGGTTTETATAPGYRIFSSANSDGSNELALDGLVFDNISLTPALLIANAPTGSITLKSTWRPDLAQVASLGIGSGYGILFADDVNSLILGVMSNGAGQAFVTYRDFNNIYGAAPLLGATGSVVLELTLDQATDKATARYSTDSGVTFLTLDTLLSPPQALAFGAGFGGTAAFGQENITVVPLPAALPFLVSGLVGLGAMARRRRVAG